MGERCQNCDKKMDYPELTHCSDDCLFDEIKNGMPTDDWDSNPWIYILRNFQYCNYVNYVSIPCQHKTYVNGLINCSPICSMELQCGCCIDEIGGILLSECKSYREEKFRN